MKPFTRLTTVLLVLIATVHLVRLIRQTTVTIGAMVVPTWVSVVGLVVATGLALGLWREHRPGP